MPVKRKRKVTKSPSKISKRTVKQMDKSVKNLKKGKVSEKIEVSDFESRKEQLVIFIYIVGIMLFVLGLILGLLNRCTGILITVPKFGCPVLMLLGLVVIVIGKALS